MTRLGRTYRWKLLGCVGRPFVALAVAGMISSQAQKVPLDGLPAPSFTPRGGLFATNALLQLSARSPDALIRYTLDGSDPDESSPLYAGPVALAKSTLVRAKAFGTGAQAALASPIAAETYTLLDADALEFSSNLPLVIINSFGTNIGREPKVLTGLQIIDAGTARARLNAAPAFSGPSLFNVRGHASLRYPKNSFTVKLLDGEGDAASVSLLGMAPESDWVLYAPYPDKTLMRDVLAYEISRQMGHWAPNTRFVEVFLNQGGGKLSRRDYAGVFVLVEKLKRDKNRVNIARLKPEDNAEPRITGGYIFKKDHSNSRNTVGGGGDLGGFPAFASSTSTRNGFPTPPGGFPGDPKGFLPAYRSGSRSSSSSSSSSSSRSVRTVRGSVTNHIGRAPRPELFSPLRDPDDVDDGEEVSRLEENWKSSRTNQFYFVEPEPDEITAVQKVWLKNHVNEVEAALYGPDFKDPARGYAAFLDADSFIDYHLTVEATKNPDGFRFSVFFTKDRGGKIKMDPIWDWNLSLGNCNGKQAWIPQNWLWPQLDDKEYSWFRRLFEDADFGQRYVDRWTQLRTNILANATLLARIDELAAQLQEAQARNFEKWPILGRAVNPNYFVGASYAEEVAWMKKYFATRLDWIEQQFPPVPQLKPAAGVGSVTFSDAGGPVYYTLDGTDPRASGGGVAAGARLAQGPVTPGLGFRLFARVKLEDNRWSGPFRLTVPL